MTSTSSPWMKSGVAPLRVSSFGGLSYFTSARAPKGAGTRCIVDCPIEDQCLYSARKHYLDHPQRWSAYVWNELQEIENPTIEQKTELLKTSVYGRCVWRSDNNVIDHQSVLVEFADGCSATHNLVGGTARPARTIHLLGTHARSADVSKITALSSGISIPGPVTSTRNMKSMCGHMAPQMGMVVATCASSLTFAVSYRVKHPHFPTQVLKTLLLDTSSASAPMSRCENTG
jgi:hypothetical protein